MLTDLNDDQLSGMLHGAFVETIAAVEPPANLVATIRARQRRRRVAALAAPTAVAAVAASFVLAEVASGSGSGTSSSTPAAVGRPATSDRVESSAAPARVIRLAGYALTLPADFHAKSGQCSVVLADGRTVRGTRGADGACLAIWTSSGRPIGMTQSPGNASSTAAVTSWQAGGQVTAVLTIHGRDGAPRYLISSATVPDDTTLSPGQLADMLQRATHD